MGAGRGKQAWAVRGVEAEREAQPGEAALLEGET